MITLLLRKLGFIAVLQWSWIEDTVHHSESLSDECHVWSAPSGTQQSRSRDE